MRVSTLDQGREGYSFDVQRSAIERYAAYKDLDFIEVIQEVVSGTVPMRERKGGRRLWAMGEGGVAVVVYRLDRLGRRAIDLMHIAEAFPALHLLDLQLDTTTPQGKMFYAMLAAFAQMERDMIAERTRDGVHRAMRDGKHVGSPPFGYRVNEDGVLIPDPREQPTVERILGMRTDNATYEAIAGTLNAAGIPTKRDARWKPITVQRVYLREVKYREL
jgi:DNA invertase Pin-like site-specific DNA recombinase